MHSGGIWNDFELPRNRWKQCTSKACIRNDLELQKIIENNYVSKACILAVFETIWNCRQRMKTWKQGRLRVQYDTFWYDILTCRENFESNYEAKWCILTPFETYARRLLGDSIVLPTPFMCIENLDVLYFSFFEMKCRPGPTGPIGATPVIVNPFVS